MAILAPKEEGGRGGFQSRNATRINLRIAKPGGGFERIGRVQSMGRSANNNIQVLKELGAQVAVELKKGISEYTFTIAKMWVRNDVFDELEQGAVFGIETADESGISPNQGTGPFEGAGAEILDVFNQVAINSIDRQYTAGQATVAVNVSCVTIGQPSGGQLSEG